MAKGDEKKVKAVVLTHRYAYHQTSGDPSTPVVEVPYAEGSTSSRGVEVEVSQAEFDRGSKMVPPALASPKDAKRLLHPGVQGPSFDSLSDDELAAIVTARGGEPDGLSRDALEAFVAGNQPTT